MESAGSAIQSIAKESTGVVVVPGVLALVAAVVSILTKEGMYWYTRFHAKKIDSSALMADAWHHRSDALSSVGALVGIAASRMGYPLMDPLASLVICVFIEKAALDIFKDAIDKMVDNLDGTSDEIVSFTSEKNTNVQSVQFVIKMPEIKKATIEVLKDEEKSPTLWERIINLFK